MSHLKEESFWKTRVENHIQILNMFLDTKPEN